MPDGTEIPAPVSATTDPASRMSSASRCALGGAAAAVVVVVVVVVLVVVVVAALAPIVAVLVGVAGRAHVLVVVVATAQARPLALGELRERVSSMLVLGRALRPDADGLVAFALTSTLPMCVSQRVQGATPEQQARQGHCSEPPQSRMSVHQFSSSRGDL